MERVWYRDFDREKPFIAFFARRDIEVGDELCISYRGNEDEEEQEEETVRELEEFDVSFGSFPLFPLFSC